MVAETRTEHGSRTGGRPRTGDGPRAGAEARTTDETAAASAPRTGDEPGGAHAASPLRRLRAPLVTAGAVGAATVLLVLRTPHVANSYGFCPLLVTTGWACPLCGGLRGTYELAHLDLAGAWAMNPLWVLLAPILVALWAVWTYRRARGTWGAFLPGWSGWALLVVLGGFGILRNIPSLQPYLTGWAH